MSLHIPSYQDDTFDLTIRFSASLPDLPLSISLAQHPHATTSTVKHLIRQSLPSDIASKRIRLIYAGKALLEDAPLTTTLKRPSRPPTRTSTPTPGHSARGDGKGKQPVRDPPVLAHDRIYIHCSIGDLVLSPTELAAEARVAHSSPANALIKDNIRGQQDDPPAALPAPRGFDRLVASGFTTSEIASLRLQFLSIQSHTHTPDTMPSPTTLRALEDAWLESSAPNSNFTLDTSAEGTGAAGARSHEENEQSALDDMIYGTAMGFFWPIGCLMLGIREEGVWSERRKMAVGVGVGLNFAMALVRYGG